MMYYAQGAPTLVSWQAELTLFQLAVQPEARQVLSDLNDVGQSTKVFARTAEGVTNLMPSSSSWWRALFSRSSCGWSGARTGCRPRKS